MVAERKVRQLLSGRHGTLMGRWEGKEDRLAVLHKVVIHDEFWKSPRAALGLIQGYCWA